MGRTDEKHKTTPLTKTPPPMDKEPPSGSRVERLFLRLTEELKPTYKEYTWQNGMCLVSVNVLEEPLSFWAESGSFVAFLGRLFVPEDHRRLGWASRTLDRLLELAEEEQVVLAVHPASFGWYQRLSVSELFTVWRGGAMPMRFVQYVPDISTALSYWDERPADVCGSLDEPLLQMYLARGFRRWHVGEQNCVRNSPARGWKSYVWLPSGGVEMPEVGLEAIQGNR